MMELTKKELKIISYEFRRISNRLLQASYKEMLSVLNIFIDCIEKEKIIYEYVRNCKREGFDVEREVQDVYGSYGRSIFSLGVTIEEEVYTVYNILKYILDNKLNVTGLASGYSNGKTYQERVKEFNNRVALVLVNNIEAYLTKINIDMGYDEEVKHMITINGTQVNISNGNSTLNAVQNNNNEPNELIKMIELIKNSIDESIPNEEKEMIIENIETVQDQLQSEKPKKGLIRTCLSGLNTVILGLPHAVKLAENVKEFVSYTSNLIK